MEKRQKERMLNMGPLEFWNESIVYYRNEVSKARTAVDFFENLELLQVCRTALRMCERRLLCAVLAVILLCSGCQTIKGVCGDTGWILTELSENIQTEK